MTWNRIRFTTGQLLVLVAVTALGLAVAPTGIEYVAALCPAAVVVRRFAPVLAVMLGGSVLAFLAFAELFLYMPVAACLYLPATLALAPPWELVAGRRRGEPSEDPGRSRRASRRRGLLYAAVYVAVGLLYFVPWTSRKPFLEALDSIRPGMTVDEVDRRMAGYMTGTGWVDPVTKQELKLDGSIVYRHSDEPAFNADWGVVTFSDGRVVEVRFDMD